MGIDLFIITIFLVTTLAIGLYESRGITTFKTYAVGSKSMSTFVLTISLVATIYGPNNIHGSLNFYYRQGLYTLIGQIANAISFYLAARYIIIRMKEFMGHLSIAESMGSIYGRTVRVTIAALCILACIMVLAGNFKLSFNILTNQLFTNVRYLAYYTAGLIGIVIVYASLGGIRAITVTDIYQFLFFSVCIPTLMCICLYHRSDLWTNWKNFTSLPYFNLSKVFTWNDQLTNALISLNHFILTFGPPHIQRVYMSSSINQATKVVAWTAIMRIIISCCFCAIVVALYIGGHVVPANQSVLDYIMRLTSFPGIQGIIITAIMALMMSLADSFLHICAVLFTNDIYPIVFARKSYQKNSLKTVRIASIVTSIVAICIAYYIDDIGSLLWKNVYFYSSAVSVPLIITCLGFRPRAATVLITIGLIAILVVSHIVQGKTIDKKDMALMHGYSVLILLSTHYLLPKKPGRGWVGIPDDSPLQLQNQETKRWWLNQLHYFQSIFTGSYWKDIFPKSGMTFIASGMYLITYSAIVLYYIKDIYKFSYMYWYIAVMGIGTIVMLYPTLHTYKQAGNRLLHGLWPILLYLVFFIAAITYMKLSHFAPISCALFMVNIGLSSLLLPCTIIILMLATALVLHRWIPPHVDFMGSFITIETIVGWTILLSCLAYRYLRNKMSRQLQTIALTRSYEQQYALASLHNQAGWNRLDPTYTGKVLQDIAATLEPNLGPLLIQQHQKKLYLFGQSLLKRAKEERTFTLNPKSIEQVDIEACILKSYETVRQLAIPIQLLLKKQTKAKHLLTDPSTFERLFTINFWTLSQSKYTIDHTVSMTISETCLSYPYPKPYHLIDTYQKQCTPPQLAALAFFISTHTDKPHVSPCYEVVEDMVSGYLPKTIDNLYQEESRQIVQAHGGYMQIIETKTSLTCLYLLPIDGKKVMRFKRYQTDDLSNKVVETIESLAQEEELTGLLVSRTTLTKRAIKEIINFIKQAHGTTMRKSGAPYYTHPVEVAKIILEVTTNPDTILAALLHDVLEDTMVTLEQLELLYGIEVAYLVDMVTNYTTHGFRWKLDASENQNILNQCKDLRVIEIKLADRLHNLRTIAARKPIDQIRIAKDTLSFYVPWARKNNFFTWLSEIENICKEILDRYGQV